LITADWKHIGMSPRFICKPKKPRATYCCMNRVTDKAVFVGIKCVKTIALWRLELESWDMDQ
jgi:hypothetical protein